MINSIIIIIIISVHLTFRKIFKNLIDRDKLDNVFEVRLLIIIYFFRKFNHRYIKKPKMLICRCLYDS